MPKPRDDNKDFYDVRELSREFKTGINQKLYTDVFLLAIAQQLAMISAHLVEIRDILKTR